MIRVKNINAHADTLERELHAFVHHHSKNKVSKDFMHTVVKQVRDTYMIASNSDELYEKLIAHAKCLQDKYGQTIIVTKENF